MTHATTQLTHIHYRDNFDEK